MARKSQPSEAGPQGIPAETYGLAWPLPVLPGPHHRCRLPLLPSGPQPRPHCCSSGCCCRCSLVSWPPWLSRPMLGLMRVTVRCSCVISGVFLCGPEERGCRVLWEFVLHGGVLLLVTWFLHLNGNVQGLKVAVMLVGMDRYFIVLFHFVLLLFRWFHYVVHSGFQLAL